jgi:putative Holliday junction resolvase
VPEERPRQGRVLGLDLGAARIGVAVSDEDRRIAVALGTINTGAPKDLRSVVALVREHEVTTVVVGEPLLMSGEAGEAARHAREFADALRAILEVPVELFDERLTTVEAERRLADAGVSGKRRRGVVDQVAATVILQAFLDARRGG